MSKYKPQSMAKIKCGEVEAASVRSKETAKVKDGMFSSTARPALPAILTLVVPYPAVCLWKCESKARQQC